MGLHASQIPNGSNVGGASSLHNAKVESVRDNQNQYAGRPGGTHQCCDKGGHYENLDNVVQIFITSEGESTNLKCDACRRDSDHDSPTRDRSFSPTLIFDKWTCRISLMLISTFSSPIYLVITASHRIYKTLKHGYSFLPHWNP